MWQWKSQTRGERRGVSWVCSRGGDNQSGRYGGGRLIRIVGPEAQDNVAHWPDHDGVPSHGHGREGLVADVVAGVFFGADDGLEGVAVEMEGMSASVVVVEYYFNYLIMFQDVRIRVDPVDGSIVGEFTG